jgi:HEPN domain-containing protein
MGRKRFPPDDPREWLNRARGNLARAKSRIPEAFLEDLCFDAQQAAEKAIFICRGEAFRVQSP